VAIRRGALADAVAALQQMQELTRRNGDGSDATNRAWWEFGAAMVDRELGDLYRLHADYPQAASHYQAALEYLRQHPTPLRPLVWTADTEAAGRAHPESPEPPPETDEFAAWRNHDLAALIQDCLAQDVAPGSPVAWKRNVDYPMELGGVYWRHHNAALAAQTYAKALDYLRKHSTTDPKYVELRDHKLPALTCVEWDRGVDYPLEFAEQYEEEAAWALAAQSYADALDFPRSRECPEGMPEERRAKYAELRQKGLAEAITRCQEKAVSSSG
jgi:tetratricopeptide (TPR) repeat protein